MNSEHFIPRLSGCLVSLVLAVVLSSCTLVPQSEPTTVYQLPPTSLKGSGVPPLKASLCIAEPQASGLLESARITVVPTANTLSAYSNVRWQSPVPTLWQNYLLDAFQRSGRVAAVVSDKQDISADYTLDSTLHAFNSEYRTQKNKSVQVMIIVDICLTQRSSKQIIATRRFSAQVAAEGEEPLHIVNAFGDASDIIATELVQWVYRQIKKG